MTEGERLKLLRKDKQMTLDKFGAVLGVTDTALSKIEHGHRPLTDQMLKSICSSFNVNEKWLRTGEGEMYNEMTEMQEVLTALGDISRTLKNSCDKADLDYAMVRLSLTSAVMKMNKEGCKHMIKFLEDMGWTKKNEDE